jgi:hypothetical protein
MKKRLLVIGMCVAKWADLSAVAQETSAPRQADTVSGKNDMMKQLFAFSAPGKQHLLLADLVGDWAFQDQKLAFVKGKIVRKLHRWNAFISK